MADDIWTIKAALDWTVGYLDRKGDEHPRQSAEWLLAEACDMRRIDLYVNFDRPLTLEERDVLRGYVSRRGRGEPLQYITGEVPFRYIAVKVRPGVLIPRPETEVLVSEALASLPAPPRRHAADSTYTDAELAERLAARRAVDAAAASGGADAADATRSAGAPDAAGAAAAVGTSGAEARGAAAAQDAEADGTTGAQATGTEADPASPAASDDVSDVAPAGAADDARTARYKVADLCTGTGCIACSIASEHPLTDVTATDISPDAVSLARENVSALGLEGRVRVVECDLADGIPDAENGAYDLVVSNPPYIPDAVMEKLPTEVADFEPSLALAGGADGLDVFRRMLPQARRLLKPGGTFACELHEDCLDAAADLAGSAGFVDIRIVNDLAGRPRVLVCRTEG